MKEKNSDSVFKRLLERTSNKVVLGVLGLLVLLLIVLWILQRCGLMLINGALLIYLPLLTLFVLVGWGGYALVRRIRRRTVKILVGSGLGLVLVLALLLVFTYASYMAFYMIPQRFAAMASPSGEHKLVVLRAFDTDEGRTEARRTARLAADPNENSEVVIQDWGYVYRAYPQVLGWFYRSNADVEGEVFLAISDFMTQTEGEQTGKSMEDAETAESDGISHGTLMVEWQDDGNTAHFFVKDPGVAEGGDCYVRF